MEGFRPFENISLVNSKFPDIMAYRKSSKACDDLKSRH